MASLMGVSYEALVIDNDMLGMAERVVRGIEVTDETLSVATIKAAVRGEGHFLGAADTLRCMETEYVYPALADRAPVALWTATGSLTVEERARARAAELLASHHVEGISAEADREIRARFPIRLDRGAMRPG